MKTKRNIILLLLIVCVLVSLFSGCEKQDNNHALESSITEESSTEELVETGDEEDIGEETEEEMNVESSMCETSESSTEAVESSKPTENDVVKPTNKPLTTATEAPKPTPNVAIEEVKEESSSVSSETVTEESKVENSETTEEISDTTEESEANIVNLGQFRLTAYCNCVICCGKWAGGATASGVMPVANHTIAVDTSVIPFGTEVIINGITYVAEDTGSAIYGNRIDIYFDTHQEAMKFGVQYAEVHRVA